MSSGRKISVAVGKLYISRALASMGRGDLAETLLWLENAIAWCRGAATPEEREKHEEEIERHIARLRAEGARDLVKAGGEQ